MLCFASNDKGDLILLADPPHWHHKPGVGQQVKKPISKNK